MHKVYYKSFVNEDDVTVQVAEFNDVYQAIEFALALHRSNNVPSRITVENPDYVDVCTLEKLKDA